MINHAGTRLAVPGKSREVVEVYFLSIEEVAGQSREALTVRCEEAPALAGQKLDVALADVDPEQTNARHKGSVGGGQVVTAAGAVEVDLVIADEVSALPVAIHAKTEPTSLLRQTLVRSMKPTGTTQVLPMRI